LDTVIILEKHRYTDMTTAETLRNVPTNNPFTMIVSYCNCVLSYIKQGMQDLSG